MHNLKYILPVLPSFSSFTGDTLPGSELSDPEKRYGAKHELSIFVAESGNTGPLPYNSLYYMICMVFHDQNDDISSDIDDINKKLAHYNHVDFFHTAPLIHAQANYSGDSLVKRKMIMKLFYSFLRKTKIKHKEIYVNKKGLNENELYTRLEASLKLFIADNASYFYNFSSVKIYYDDGQKMVKHLLVNVLGEVFSNVEFRKIKPSNYRLFQVADLICSLRWLEIKLQIKNLSKAELRFFEGERNLMKRYLKPLEEKEFK